MISCHQVTIAAENRTYSFLDEEHAELLADHLGVKAVAVVVTETSTMRQLQSEDHAAESEALLTRYGV